MPSLMWVLLRKKWHFYLCVVPGPKWLSVLCLDDVSSAPVVGAEVVVELPGKPPKKMKATTGENGTASFSLESQGGGGEGGGASVTALISVEADGYLPVQEQVNPEEVGWKITIRLGELRHEEHYYHSYRCFYVNA